MAKQIKLGFDKGTSREKDADQILVDVRGNQLEDSKGSPLYTETVSTPTAFFSSKNATSVHVNNEPAEKVGLGKSIAIIEQFPELSEVATSLLGIPRLGKQQSLFADVSVYGLDDKIWEFYSSPNPGQPAEWLTRYNKKYGRRADPKLKEYSNEQAVALEVFPVNWTFPWGPRFDEQGYYNPTLFARYKNFITLGNALYDYYASRNLKEFAENHFLIPGAARVNTISVDPPPPGQEPEIDLSDVIYNPNFAYALDIVEQWTMTWMDIRDLKLEDPLRPGQVLSIRYIDNLFNGKADPGENPATLPPPLGFVFNSTQPGYSANVYRYCQLQSKESFRYQPGAISGFTFGVRLNADESTLTNVIEWGCANTTDQFMFQVKGSQFSIVRRSTVPLTTQNLALMKLTPADQTVVQSPNPYERNNTTYTTTDLGLPPAPIRPLYQVVIRSDNFNGDTLDGSGKSGYNISFNEVTMYKIEYSWYGAIGAKFYAYIPVGNAEARWVLLHTFVIENTLDNPSLQNPYMHFRYCIYQNNTSSLREPMYLYKYGASYYIDGSDEGTYLYNAYKTPIEKNITSINSVPVIGFKPKGSILNRDGAPIENQKNFYIEEISVSSNRNARIDILECEGCPDGHGHFYATGLQNGQSGLVDQFTITDAGTLQFTDPTKKFDRFAGYKKIIAPGIYSAYIKYPANVTEDTSDIVDIRRRLGGRQGSSNINVDIGSSTFNDINEAYINGQPTKILGLTFTGRLTGYDDIKASNVVLSKPNISVRFLNPLRRESTSQFCEFAIGITDKRPEVTIAQVDGTEKQITLFNGFPLDLESTIYGEYHQYSPSKDIQGVEVGESDVRAGNNMQQDFRIGRPKGADSGECSELNFEIRNSIIRSVSYTTINLSQTTAPIEGSHFIVFDLKPDLTIKYNGSDIGVLGPNGYITSGITFTSDVVEFIDTETEIAKYIVAISDDISSRNIEDNGIALRLVRCFGRYINKTKIITFGASEFYLFVAMRDNAGMNSVVVKEFDDFSSFSHTPNWLTSEDTNIVAVDVDNPDPPANIVDKLPTQNEYIGNDGLYYMGGVTFTGNLPSNFSEKSRLVSVQYDTQLNLPLRPALLKTSLYIGANTTETVKMNHLYGQDRLKLNKDSTNNKSLYISSSVTDQEGDGSFSINIISKEQ